MGGDTVIGANSTIGANVFLTKSVPPHSLVYYEEKEVLSCQNENTSPKPHAMNFSNKAADPVAASLCEA